MRRRTNDTRIPNEFIRKGAREYNECYRLGPLREGLYVHVDEGIAHRIASAYEDLLTDDSSNPAVIRAYTALRVEVSQQWDYATREMGIRFESWTKPGQPYANSEEMLADLRLNRHLFFFQGGTP